MEEHNILLAVSLPHLDSEAEMRKFFGSKVVSVHHWTFSVKAPTIICRSAPRELKKSNLAELKLL